MLIRDMQALFAKDDGKGLQLNRLEISAAFARPHRIRLGAMVLDRDVEGVAEKGELAVDGRASVQRTAYCR
jgi:hypothetical protein